MSDNYQAVYDAICASFNMADHRLICLAQEVGAVVGQAVESVKKANKRPSVLYRPSLHKKSMGWFMSYGDIEVVGSTPERAAEAFDYAWQNRKNEDPEGRAYAEYDPSGKLVRLIDYALEKPEPSVPGNVVKLSKLPPLKVE